LNETSGISGAQEANEFDIGRVVLGTRRVRDSKVCDDEAGRPFELRYILRKNYLG
jgi:hypothetical protein